MGPVKSVKVQYKDYYALYYISNKKRETETDTEAEI